MKIDLQELKARALVNACPSCGREEAQLTYLHAAERDALVREIEELRRVAEAAKVLHNDLENVWRGVAGFEFDAALAALEGGE